MIRLRPRQVEAMRRLYAAMSKHRRVLFVAPTGMGKRICAVWFCMQAAAQGRYVLFVTNRRLLVQQAFDEMRKVGLDHGVVMAGIDPGNLAAHVQIASVQSLESWYFKGKGAHAGTGAPAAEVIIIDECHEDIDRYRRLMEYYPTSKVVGLTATPVGPSGASLIPQHYDVLVEGCLNTDLISDRLLLPTRVLAPSEPNIQGVKVTKGEFNQSDLGDRVQECTVFADVFKELEPYEDRRAVCFVPGVAYGHFLADQFNRKLGPGQATMIHAAMPQDERDAALGAVREGRSRVLLSVNILCLDEQTEICTTDGWVGIDGMTKDHWVANWTPYSGEIEFHKPQEIFVQDRAQDRNMVSGPGLRVTADHTLAWKLPGEKQWRVTTAAEARSAGKIILPLSGKANPLDPLDAQARSMTWCYNRAQIDQLLRAKCMGWDGEKQATSYDPNKKVNVIPQNPGDGSWCTQPAMMQALLACKGFATNLKDGKLAIAKDTSETHPLQLQLETHHKPERVWCVKTNSGYIVTRRNGLVRIVGNCTGFDMPEISLGIDLQPNRQLRNYWQKVGRIKRSYPGQKDAVLLDFAGNAWRFPHPDTDPDWPTGDETTQDRIKKNREDGKEKQQTRCPKCSLVFTPTIRPVICPQCGHKFTGAARKVVRMEDGSLKELSAETKKRVEKTEYERDLDIMRGLTYAGWSKGWTYKRLAAIFKAKTGRWPSLALPGTHSPDSVPWDALLTDLYTSKQDIYFTFSRH